MDSVSGCPVSAARRTPRIALRPVLILGGLVAVWWALMAGVAHADGGPRRHHLVHQVPSPVAAERADARHEGREHRARPGQEASVGKALRRTHHVVEATQVASVMHETAVPVTRTVARTASTAVDATSVAPAAKRAVATIGVTVSKTVGTARALVTQTPAGPAVGSVGSTVDQSVKSAESSTSQGKSRSVHRVAIAHAGAIDEPAPSSRA